MCKHGSIPRHNGDPHQRERERERERERKREKYFITLTALSLSGAVAGCGWVQMGNPGTMGLEFHQVES